LEDTLTNGIEMFAILLVTKLHIVCCLAE